MNERALSNYLTLWGWTMLVGLSLTPLLGSGAIFLFAVGSVLGTLLLARAQRPASVPGTRQAARGIVAAVMLAAVGVMVIGALTAPAWLWWPLLGGVASFPLFAVSRSLRAPGRNHLA